MTRVDFSNLSAEIWVKTLSLLVPNSCDLKDGRKRLEACAADQARFHNLKSVSKRLKVIVEDNPFQFGSLALDSCRTNTSDPSLLAWLHTNSAHVRCLISDWSSTDLLSILEDDAGVSALLTTLYLERSSSQTLQSIAKFTSVTKVSLCHPTAGTTNLNPLDDLPSLHTLVLSSGNFENCGLPQSLTSLHLQQARLSLTLPRDWAKTLRKLSIVSSDLVGHNICNSGVLEELYISESHVYLDEDEGATNDVDFCATEDFICADLSHLRKLRVLNVKIASHLGIHGDNLLDWEYARFLYRLPLLLELTIGSTHMRICISDALTQLKSLQRLSVVTAPSVESRYDDSPASIVLERIKWQSMAALQHVHIQASTLQCGFEILRLFEVNSLLSVSLGCKPVDSGTVAVFAALSYGMALHRPQVQLSFNGRRLTDMISHQQAADECGPEDDEWY